ncbi:ATP-binding cassette domain-containing protein [Pseudooceanicola sp. CBS1P-1]|nr:ATP-binding cassette domain-containing protein [Pseudooceanicola endophyticus]
MQALSVTTTGPAPRRVLDDLSLTLVPGRVLALVGASGSGKSTAVSAALGVLSPGLRLSGGEIRLDGRPAAPKALRGRIVASVLQNPRSAFNPLRSMRDHVQETLRALGRDWDARRVHDTLSGVGIETPEQILPLYPFEMSGGMLQRVMIALALLSEAPYLFADEPTTDLDLVVQARILDLLADAQARHGLGMLLITHDMGVVARLADEVAVLDRGRIVEQAPVGDLFHAPRHPVSRMLIDAHLSLYDPEPAR